MPKSVVGLAIGTALAMACSGPTGPLADVAAPPDDFELPPPDTSLDPNRLSVGDYIATPCAFGQWGNGLTHLRDKNEWALVDVYFGRGSPEGPWDGPTADDIELVQSHGGRVLYGFHVPAVRARMILSRIPNLVQEGWITVRDVPDATRYDVPLMVGFNRPLTEDDVQGFASLGGRVTSRLEFINALGGILPDRSIAAYHGRSDVKWVQAEGVLCLD